MFLAIFIFLTTAMTAQPTAQPYTDAAVVWRGFTHQWTYNHRLNRLGNYILNPVFTQFPYQAQMVHTSATGVGGDVGFFDAQYSYLAMRNVAVQSGVVNIEFSGREGDMHNTVKHLLTDSKIAMQPQSAECVVVLNGFDILSERKADKVSLLNISVGEAEYLPASNKIKFDVSASLEVTCKSFECNRFNQKFDYKIQIHYLIFMTDYARQNVVAAPDKSSTLGVANVGGFHATEQTIQRVYNWDKDTELDLSPESHTLSGIKDPTFGEAILAFKSISLHLDRDHWMLDWHSAILPEQYDPQTGKFKYSLDLLFKQWDESMKRNSANPRISRFSGKRRGWAIQEATVCMLQFHDAFVRHADRSGIVKWDGHNQSAGADASVQRYDVVLNDSMLTTQQVDLYRQRGIEAQDIKQQYEKYIKELEKKRSKNTTTILER